MASYNKAKLLRLLEQRHGTHLALTDLSDRAREAREDFRHHREMNRRAGSAGATSFRKVERLLARPLVEAEAIQREEVEDAGLHYPNWARYLAAWRKMTRLEQQIGAAKTEFDSFAVVPRLCEAVRDWGFRDPELEI